MGLQNKNKKIIGSYGAKSKKKKDSTQSKVIIRKISLQAGCIFHKIEKSKKMQNRLLCTSTALSRERRIDRECNKKKCVRDKLPQLNWWRRR